MPRESIDLVVTGPATYPDTEATNVRKALARRKPASPHFIRFCGQRYRRHVVYSHKQTPLYVRLPAWRRIGKRSQIHLALEAMLSAPGQSVFAFSVNLHEELERNLSTDSADYIRDQIRKALSRALPNQSLSFFIVVEPDIKTFRYHIHGAVLVPDTINEGAFSDYLAEVLKTTPLSRKYRQRWTNRTAHVQNTYKKNGAQRPIDGGFASYCTKNFGYRHSYAMSPELTRRAKEFLAKLKGCD